MSPESLHLVSCSASPIPAQFSSMTGRDFYALRSLENILCLTKLKYFIKEAQMEAVQFLKAQRQPFIAKQCNPYSTQHCEKSQR